MSTIKNTSKKAISVPLPGGKRLFLSPGKSGRISPKAIDHPPLVALLESGELELEGTGKGFRGGGKGSGGSGSGGQSHTSGKKMFKSGDG